MASFTSEEAKKKVQAYIHDFSEAVHLISNSGDGGATFLLFAGWKLIRAGLAFLKEALVIDWKTFVKRIGLLRESPPEAKNPETAFEPEA